VALATDISPILQLRKMGVISSGTETSSLFPAPRVSVLGCTTNLLEGDVEEK
jgi:hypothetical protein